MRFEKVSLEQACKEYERAFNTQPDKEVLRKVLERLELPTRSTDGSVGYDFHSPFEIDLRKGRPLFFPLFVTVKDMPKDVALFIYNRSGLSIRQGVTLDNAVGIIDSDYYPLGIGCQLTSSRIDVHIKEGGKVCQGIFHKCLFVDDDTQEGNKRNGGFGSTGV